MKKLLMGSVLMLGLSFMASAQTTSSKTKVTPNKTTTTTTTSTKVDKDKVKPTSTVPQKVHNMVRPKHKKYSGVKAKAKTTK